MPHPKRIFAVFGVVALLAVLAGLALRRGAPIHTLAVEEVPAQAQRAVLEKLGAVGYSPVEEPVWAGGAGQWQAPGDYTLFFVAHAEGGAADVFRAQVKVDSMGSISGISGIAPVVATPAGEEASLVLADGWLGFATRVASLYQTVTCVPLQQPSRADVYAFGRPAQHVALAWRSEEAAGPRLQVSAEGSGEELHLTIVASERRVEPDQGDLQYLPVVRGEQAWLPNLVSRVRELPGVGPEKIAFLENVVFTLIDHVTRLVHGRLGAEVAGVPSASLTPTVALSPTLQQPTARPALDDATPVATPTEAVMVTPPPTPTPTGRMLADGIVWRETVNPDPQRPYANVEIVEIDPAQLQVKMICGTHEPRPSTGLVGTGVIPEEDWPLLVAGFNGGFAAMHGQYGMMVDRKVYLPARDGIATLAVYEDGSIRMGTWGKDLTLTPDMVSYRQNCPPLIENGIITAETGKLTLWGLSVANEVYLYRSGLGVTRDGRLVYVAGKPLSAYTLARALQMAGAHYAMQLDVDEFHVAFITYDIQQNEAGGLDITGRKLRDDMQGFGGYFLRPFQLDFFYLTRRPERLENAIRLAPQLPEPVTAGELERYDLPGRIAFASDRDGDWEIYSLKPGQPDSVQQLTYDPADDLYPAWTRDGEALAFASRRDGNAEIYVMGADGSSPRRVTEQESEEWAPAWSPDGQRLVYQSDRNGQSDIYVCALDGKGELRLTPMEGNHEAPDWSPDGQRIVFDSDLDVSELVHASINLYFMGPDGANPYRVISNAEFPRWSPDGRTVAFISRRTGRWQVYLLNADGSGLRQLTRADYDARYPAWSPDGQWIAFAGNESGRWELYAIPVEGGEPLRLTASAGDSTYPSWAP